MNRLYEWVDQAWQWIAERVFVRFQFDIDPEKLKGRRVIFALTSGGLIDWIILSSWCRKNGLGPVLVSSRLRTLCLGKPIYFFQVLFKRKSFSDLFRSEKERGPRLIFCKQKEPRKPFEPTRSEIIFSDLSADPHESLIVPIFIVWRRYVRGAPRRPMEYLLGLSSNPNWIGKAWYLLVKRSDSTVRALEYDVLPPADSGPEKVGKGTRRRILVRVNQEMRAVLGPRYLAPHTVKEVLLRDPEIEKLMGEISTSQNIPKKRVLLNTYRILTEIVAKYSYRTIEIMYVFLTWLFTKVFDGVEYKQEDLERIREKMKTKEVVYVPCHRSHFDYLVLPYVLFCNEIATPYFAAGINLSFWPMGPFLRGGGAFFIRRTFRGDPLYSLCFKKYVELLLSQKQSFTFFIEGTRSRTGKMLPPTYGLLKMVMEAHSKSGIEDIELVPVSIAYDQIPEEKTYGRELSGGKKEKESTKLLLKSRSVIKNRIGKVYLNFSESLNVTDLHKKAQAQNVAPELMLQKAAFELSKSIADVTPVTPKGMASVVVLSHRMSALNPDRIVRLSMFLYKFARWSKAATTVSEESVVPVIQNVLARMKQSGYLKEEGDYEGKTYFSEDKGRSVITIYKNACIHHYLTLSIFLLSALHSIKANGLDAPIKKHITSIQLFALKLRNYLKFEFYFDPSDRFRVELMEHARFLLGENWEERPLKDSLEQAYIRLPDWDDMFFLARSVGDLIESYVFALEHIRELNTETDSKALTQRLVKAAHAKEGGVIYPESISIQNYNNAISLFLNLNFVEKNGTGKLIPRAWGSPQNEVLNDLQTCLDLIETDPTKILGL